MIVTTIQREWTSNLEEDQSTVKHLTYHVPATSGSWGGGLSENVHTLCGEEWDNYHAWGHAEGYDEPICRKCVQQFEKDISDLDDRLCEFKHKKLTG